MKEKKKKYHYLFIKYRLPGTISAMNDIQFGSSDVDELQHIDRLIRDDTDFRGTDGLILVFRRVTLCAALHVCL